VRRELRYLWLAIPAVVIGLVAGARPDLALAATIGAAFVPIALGRPIVGLCMLLLLSFLEVFTPVGGGITLTKLIGLLLFIGWFGALAAAGPADRWRRGLLASEPRLAASLLLFVAWAAMSLVWSTQTSNGASALLRFALNFTLFPIVLVAVRRLDDVIWLYVVFVTGALTAAAYGQIHASSLAATTGGRLKGGGLNPNELGEVLVVAIVLAATLAANRRWSAPARVTAFAAASLAAIALFLTLSRGALIGLGVALLVAPFAVGRGRRAAALALATLAILGTVGWFAVIASPSSAQRITHPQEAGGSGRETLWKVGWRMFEAHPVNGVGVGNYQVVSIHYLLRPGSTQEDKFIVDTPAQFPPHNIYLSVLSELGIIGLTLFLAILGLTLAAALRAARLFARRGDPIGEILARGLFIALTGYLAALFFSTSLYSKQLWLLLALAPALQAIAVRGAAAEDTREALVGVRRPSPPPTLGAPA
jgi:putative inorganic carbon (hco3(-)) transporter